MFALALWEKSWGAFNLSIMDNKTLTVELIKTFTTNGKLNVLAMIEFITDTIPLLENYNQTLIRKCQDKRRMKLLTDIYEFENQLSIKKSIKNDSN